MKLIQHDSLVGAARKDQAVFREKTDRGRCIKMSRVQVRAHVYNFPMFNKFNRKNTLLKYSQLYPDRETIQHPRTVSFGRCEAVYLTASQSHSLMDLQRHTLNYTTSN